MSEAVEAYLAALPPDQQTTLRALRGLLQSILPDHVETISYGMPGFREPVPKGKMVIGYAAFARHMGLYPHSGSVIPLLKDDCAGFKTSKSGVLFTSDNPLPEQLVRKIIATRQAELAAGYGR
jgi:uncharacterized protein YdhG (YjbR/CyaY superfamily)